LSPAEKQTTTRIAVSSAPEGIGGTIHAANIGLGAPILRYSTFRTRFGTASVTPLIVILTTGLV